MADTLSPEFLKQVVEADKLFRKREYEAAITLGRSLLEREPNHVPLLRVVGFALLKVGKAAQARQLFERTLIYDSQKGRAFAAVACTYLAEYRYSEAVNLYRLASEHGMTANKDFDDWYKAERAMGEDGDTANVMRKAAQLCEFKGSVIPQWLERLLSDDETLDDEVEQIILSRLRQQSRNEDTLSLQIRILLTRKQFETAFHELEAYRSECGHTATWFDLLRAIHRERALNQIDTPTTYVS